MKRAPVLMAVALLSIAVPILAAPAKTRKAPAASAPAPSFRSGIAPADLPSPAIEGGSDEAQQTAKRALAAFAQGDLATARKAFEEVLRLSPENVATMINLALIAQRQRDFATAETLLKRALRLQPESGLAWLLLGVVAYEQDKLDAALAALAQAALYEPKDARVRHFLGVTIGRKGWYSGAEEEMRKAIELQPGYAEAHFNLAVFYLQRSPPAVELARRHYQKSLDLGSSPDATVERLMAAALQ